MHIKSEFIPTISYSYCEDNISILIKILLLLSESNKGLNNPKLISSLLLFSIKKSLEHSLSSAI